ncbi:hypothetical protein BOTBODRAFT_52614 [Botryobasidium botryosum FD-172 SS1]|uniref:Uncharacterized protein n=1 Tax=Botryobasidium botryosum (strain FD-172 SS1) TaxID=930990 RepID=A0A067N4F0_BOTB1|nr:hypothetical protein BOTBODRAFT_52614 [Botryobasidium botryosum FD-172 SS1]
MSHQLADGIYQLRRVSLDGLEHGTAGGMYTTSDGKDMPIIVTPDRPPFSDIKSIEAAYKG